MLDTAEFVLKIAFISFTIIWIGKILILRTDKQIVINPLLIAISAILVVLPDYDEYLGSEVTLQEVKIALYTVYCLIIIFGIYSLSKKNNLY
ncbi:MAG: hypothetical protein ACRCXA_13455 [Peptostreptococcaceae bacterium]